MTPWLGLLLVVLLAVLVALPVGLAAAARYRHLKVVRCPRLGWDAPIKIARAGLAEALGRRSLRRVASCPLRDEACREECLALPDEALRDLRV
jgi:hypothetical protein